MKRIAVVRKMDRAVAYTTLVPDEVEDLSGIADAENFDVFEIEADFVIESSTRISEAGDVSSDETDPDAGISRFKALAEIAALEQSVARPVREVLLAISKGHPADQAAVQKIQEVEAKIEELRRKLN